MRGIPGQAQPLDRLRLALDELEGYPRQGVYADGRTPPPGVGITETVGRVVNTPDGPALKVREDVLNRHQGKQRTIGGQPVTIPPPSQLEDLPRPPSTTALNRRPF